MSNRNVCLCVFQMIVMTVHFFCLEFSIHAEDALMFRNVEEDSRYLSVGFSGCQNDFSGTTLPFGRRQVEVIFEVDGLDNDVDEELYTAFTTHRGLNISFCWFTHLASFIIYVSF